MGFLPQKHYKHYFSNKELKFRLQKKIIYRKKNVYFLIFHIGSRIKIGNGNYIKSPKVTAQNINCSCLLIIWPL